MGRTSCSEPCVFDIFYGDYVHLFAEVHSDFADGKSCQVSRPSSWSFILLCIALSTMRSPHMKSTLAGTQDFSGGVEDYIGDQAICCVQFTNNPYVELFPLE